MMKKTEQWPASGRPLRFATICSGIEATSEAWKSLGWEAQFFSEIERFPKAVLRHHYPGVPDLGDATKIFTNKIYKDAAFDVFAAGTPCVGFSLSGKRGGMGDPRSQLAWTYVDIVREKRPRWILWENVPDVRSSWSDEKAGPRRSNPESGGTRQYVDQTNDFDQFLLALAECGYGLHYRVLDAQFSGLAQRRERLFVVGYLGGWQAATAVLFDTASRRGDPPPSRPPGPDLTYDIAPCIVASGVGTRKAGNQKGADAVIAVPHVAGTLTSGGKSAGSANLQMAMQGNLVCVGGSSPKERDVAATLMGHHPRGDFDMENFVTSHDPTYGVRRLTPIECERLMGFPDDYTKVPVGKKTALECADFPRYKAIGNSMPVTVMRWLGQRIEMVERLMGRKG